MTGPAWIVVPTYNEAANLGPLVRGVRESAPGARILVVDDNSPDGTGRLAEELAAADPYVEVLHRPGKAGLGLAYVNGFAHALRGGADYVVEMDADLSHDPADLPRLIGPAFDGADLVLGSRYVRGGGIENWGLERRVLSRFGCGYARRMLGVGVRDLTGGFKCFRAGALRALDGDLVHSRGYAFQIELTFHAARAGLEIAEIPIVFREREHGVSKMSPAIALEAMWRVPLMRMGTVSPAPDHVTPRAAR